MFLQKIDKLSNFRDILLQFSTDDIKKIINDSTIFSRGNSYYKRDYVFDLKQTENNLVKSKVSGSSSNSYEVDIYREGDSLRVGCDCPYDSVCKHIVATLLQISKTKTLDASTLISNKDTLLNHLQTLSNSQLIKLVMGLATEDFVKEIMLKDTPLDKLGIHLNKIETSIEMDMNNEDLLYNPEKFQKNISKYMKNLKPFVNKSCNEVFEIVFDLAEDIETKQDEGYLFIDDYYDEKYFDFDTFSSEIMELIKKIEDSEKQIEIFVQFADICDSSGHIEVDYNDLEIKDSRVLLEYFNEDSNLDLYYFIEEFLSFEEREKFLLKNSQYGAYNLVISLYLEYNKDDLAVAYIEKLMQKKFDLDYIQKLIEITEISKDRLRGFIIGAIEDSVYRHSNFILENISKIDNRDEIEKSIKGENLDIYYRLLQQEDRVAEMFGLLDKLPNEKNSFLKKYKHQYPIEAMELFREEIKQNLKSTGNEYYKNIAEYLTHLRELIDEEEFDSIVTGFKTEYKRRKNFIAILDRLV